MSSRTVVHPATPRQSIPVRLSNLEAEVSQLLTALSAYRAEVARRGRALCTSNMIATGAWMEAQWIGPTLDPDPQPELAGQPAGEMRPQHWQHCTNYRTRRRPP